MNENLDLDELREKLRFAQSVPNVELVLKLIQELEETRAKHRKEWRRAERAEESRLHANVMINTVLEEMGSGPETDPIIKVRQLVASAEAAEAAVQRVRDAIKDAPTSDPTRGRTGPPDDWPDDGELIGQGEFLVAEQVRRALDGGE